MSNSHISEGLFKAKKQKRKVHHERNDTEISEYTINSDTSIGFLVKKFLHSVDNEQHNMNNISIIFDRIREGLLDHNICKSIPLKSYDLAKEQLQKCDSLFHYPHILEQLEEKYTKTQSNPNIANEDNSFGFITPNSISKQDSDIFYPYLPHSDNITIMNIEMPQELVHEKDHINFRIWKKRAIYSGFLSVYISSIIEFKDMQQYIPFTLDMVPHPLFPTEDWINCLKLSYFDQDSIPCSIYIVITIPTDIFKSRLNSDRNSIRPAYFGKMVDDPHSIPSPIYNHIVISLSSNIHDRLYSDTIQSSLLLAKKWLLVRKDILPRFGLIHWKNVLNAQKLEGLDSFEIFKFVLSIISNQVDTIHPTLEVQNQARASLLAINHFSPKDAFDYLFTYTKTPIDSFDDLIYLELNNSQIALECRSDIFINKLVASGSLNYASIYWIKSLLEEGLSNRLSESISVMINDDCSAIKGSFRFIFGIRYNPNEWMRLVDKGPKFTDSDSVIEKWRSFWGEKSELRKFKDSTMVESVVWQDNINEWSRYGITWQIIDYVLQRHVVIPHHFKLVGLSLIDRQLAKIVSNTKQRQEITTIWEELINKHLMALDSPLSIKSILQIDPIFRTSMQCNILPGSTTPLSFLRELKQLSKRSRIDGYILNERMIPVILSVIRLEPSSKWPIDDYKAWTAMVIAYLLHLSKGLTKLGRETSNDNMFWSSVSYSEPPYMDVFYKGLIFRFCVDMIESNPDAFIQKFHNDGIVKSYSSRVNLSMNYHSDSTMLLFQPINHHTQFIRQYCHRYPHSYPGTVHLISQWLSMHQLLPTFTHEVVELLVAKVFDCNTYIEEKKDIQIPNTPFRGFVQVLQLLARFDFLECPLIIDNTINDKEDISINVIESDGSERVYKSILDWKKYVVEQFQIFRNKNPLDMKENHKELIKRMIYISTINDTFSDLNHVDTSLDVISWMQDCARMTLKQCISYDSNEDFIFKNSLQLPKHFTQHKIVISRGKLLRKIRTELCKRQGLLEHKNRDQEKKIDWLSTTMTPGLDPLDLTINELMHSYDRKIDIFCENDKNSTIINWRFHES